MNRFVRAVVLLAVTSGSVEPCFAQDALAEHKIRGLKRLPTLAIVLRANTSQEVVSLKELRNMVEVALRRDIPKLGRSEPLSARAWLELSVISTDAGGVVELSLYRWTRILDSGEQVFSKVWWDSKGIFGSISKESLKEALDSLLTSFAADYSRAMG